MVRQALETRGWHRTGHGCWACWATPGHCVAPRLHTCQNSTPRPARTREAGAFQSLPNGGAEVDVVAEPLMQEH